jgi:hypothetical protein
MYRIEVFYQGLCSWVLVAAGLRADRQRGTGMISVTVVGIKGGHLSGGILGIVVNEFGERKKLASVVLVEIAVDS